MSRQAAAIAMERFQMLRPLRRRKAEKLMWFQDRFAAYRTIGKLFLVSRNGTAALYCFPLVSLAAFL